MNQSSKSILLMLLWLATAFPLTIRADTDKSVTAAQVNGTWKTKSGEFKVWALGKQRLQVEFSGVYEYKTSQGPMANEGEAAVSRPLKATQPSSNRKALKRNAGSRSNSPAAN